VDNPTTALAVDPLTGRLLDSRYELGAPLARGGMATVYSAVDRRLDRDVAVKVMHSAFAHDPDFVLRFEREAKAAARISDPNVVAVHDTGTDGVGRDRVVYLVMELVRGHTLREVLTARGRLAPHRALEVLEPVLRALAAAHRAGLVHRDVKPENVLLSDDGAVKVADFGLVRSVEGSALTGPVILGTVAYLAPEQIGQGEVGPATDVYAAGICLYEMLTGAAPYSGDDPRAVAFRRLHEDVPVPSSVVGDLPPSVDALVRHATAADPADRYADAAEFLVAVRTVRRTLPVPASPRQSRSGDTTALPLDEFVTQILPAGAPRPEQTAPTRQRKPKPPRPARSPAARRRRTWTVLVILFVLICIAAVVGGWWFGSGRYVTVPRLAGLTTAQATTALRSQHLDAQFGAPEHSDTVARGLVADGSPDQGKRLTRGSNVTLHVSTGVLTIAVPPVANKPVAEARAALTGAGLTVGSTTNDYSDTVPTGSVISTTPPAGTALDHRTAVLLTVSQGPTPVAVPDLRGEPQAQALATLHGLGLTPSLTSGFSPTVAAGSVLNQTPGAGTAHHGDKIALVISKGPQLVAVPDIKGLGADEAVQELQADGLVPNEHDLFGIPGNVVAYSPGGMVKPGTTITFYTA
jgi:beta-lactam-binding protein with PASTA domain